MAEPSEISMPSMENICNGTSEKLVIRSKLRRIRLYIEYLDSPAARSSCPTTTSAGIAREAVGQRRDEGADFLAAVDRVDDVAVVGAEHAALVGHLDAGDLFAQAVHGARGDMAPHAVAALAADGADVIVALVHLRQQQSGVFRRVLQVGIQRHDALAAALLETGHDGHVLAEIAVEQHHTRHIGAFLELFAQDGGGTVAAAIVDEHDLIRDAELVQCGIEAVKQGLQPLFFVIDGNNNGKLGDIHRIAFYRRTPRARQSNSGIVCSASRKSLQEKQNGSHIVDPVISSSEQRDFQSICG